jgi:hypothetical protein
MKRQGELLPEIKKRRTLSRKMFESWYRFAGCKVIHPVWPECLIFDSEMRPWFVWIKQPSKMGGKGRESANLTRTRRMFERLGINTDVVQLRNPKASFVDEEKWKKAEEEMSKDLKGECEETTSEEIEEVFEILSGSDSESESVSESEEETTSEKGGE